MTKLVTNFSSSNNCSDRNYDKGILNFNDGSHIRRGIKSNNSDQKNFDIYSFGNGEQWTRDNNNYKSNNKINSFIVFPIFGFTITVNKS